MLYILLRLLGGKVITYVHHLHVAPVPFFAPAFGKEVSGRTDTVWTPRTPNESNEWNASIQASQRVDLAVPEVPRGLNRPSKHIWGLR